jgi:N-acetylated-alpha-linked acidic dipeptidase
VPLLLSFRSLYTERWDAQIIGLAVLKAASTPVLPLNVSAYAEALKYYADSVRSVAPPSLNLSPLYDVIANVEDSARSVDIDIEVFYDRLKGALHNKNRRELHRLFRFGRKINRRLKAFERGFIDEKGLENRTWYKHLGVAPGRWLGYGSTTFPGVTEAITIDGDLDMAERELERLVKSLRGIDETLRL